MTWQSLLLVAAAAVVGWLMLMLVRAHRDQDASARQLHSVEAQLAAVTKEMRRVEAALNGTRVGLVLIDPAGALHPINSVAAGLMDDRRHAGALISARILALRQAALAGDAVDEVISIRSPWPRTFSITARRIEDNQWAAIYVDDITARANVDAARSDFVANVSHELKTPLGALALLAETLGGAEDVASRKKLIARIGEQTARMTRLVEDIMDLSLVEAGGTDLAVVNVAEVLDIAGAAVQDIARASGVAVEVLLPDAEVKVLGDERQLISAVSNLLSNAVAYTAVARPPQRVTLRSYVTDTATIVEVADTGIGVPANHISRIFERFYRVDSARSRETGGTGLGLSIVRHVALNHGGSVEVDSESGVGSTFRIVLPLGFE